MRNIAIFVLIISMILAGCQGNPQVKTSKGQDMSNTESSSVQPIDLEPLGMTLDAFKEAFNDAMKSDFADYQLGNIVITPGDKYDHFQFSFPNQEILTGVVGKDGQLMVLEFIYPSRPDDKTNSHKRMMTIGGCIATFLVNDENLSVTREQFDAITAQLNMTEYTQEKQARYEQGQEFASIFNRLKFTRQLQASKEYSAFRIVRPNDDELDTVEGAPQPQPDTTNDELTGWAKYQKAAADYYVTGIVPEGWVPYDAPADVLLSDVENGIAIYHNGECYTDPERGEERVVYNNDISKK